MHGILVGVDGSGHSNKALEWAVREAAVREVPLTVLTVHQPLVGYSGTAVLYLGDAERTEEAEQAARQAAKQQLDTALARVTGTVKPPAVDVRAVTGIPAEGLLSAAAGADMIVVGSRGAGGFTRLLMGSVAAQVTHHAHCPVVVVPAGTEREAK
jgi:nucleotide-binding universal stress UspA family protein